MLSKFSARSNYIDAFPVDSGLLPSWLHPGRAARAVIDGLTVGYFGQLHPSEADRRKLKQPVFIGELYLDRLYKQSLRQPAARELSRYQAVQRDFSFIFPNAVKWAEIAAELDGLAIPELVSYEAKEILRDPRGERVPARPLFASARRCLSIRDPHPARRGPAKLLRRDCENHRNERRTPANLTNAGAPEPALSLPKGSRS